MSKITFVSGCDAAYYPLLREWIHSLQQCTESKNFDINILDAGLTDEQKTALEPLVKSINVPEWPAGLPSHKIHGREYLKACVCRPFLPEIFPGYGTYVWMDADTWIQNWDGIELFLKGTAKNKISLTGQVDRAYPRIMRIKWLGPWPRKVRSFYFSNARKAFGFKTAKKLLPYHVLSAGAFALRRDAPHWKRWQELTIQAAQKGNVFTAEQLGLGILCYLEGYEFEMLPAWTHWLCQFKPLWDKASQKFVEPYLPNNPLSILHLSGYDEMRLDRTLTTDFKTTDDTTIELSYRYPDFDGKAETETLPSAA